ncbi:MAG TPA: hypothetical protein VGW74_07030 [Propionibacteriaceae bacterium]|nr:hypothetical protein [Propionibacteriaceae bacterium]
MSARTMPYTGGPRRTPLADAGLTLGDIASTVGASLVTIGRYAYEWQGPSGSGRPRAYSGVDILVAQAWFALQAPTGGADVTQRARSYRARQDRAWAEAAIRRRPGRYLVIGPDGADTYDDQAEAIDAWVAAAPPGTTRVSRLIDLFDGVPA